MYILAFCLIGSIAAIAYGPERAEVLWHFGFYTLAFTCFLGLCRYASGRLSWSFLIVLAIVLRLICVFAFPKHSDDVYRYIWDGRLAVEDNSPYAFLPSSLDSGLIKDQNSLLIKMNSQEHYSVYPWVHQGVFYLSAIVGNNVYWTTVSIKLVLVLFDLLLMLCLLALFDKFNIERNRLLLYFLNPLIVVEIALNAHFEGVALLGVILSIFLILTKRYIRSSMLFFIAVSTKLNPLILLPLLLIHIRSYKSIFKFVVPLGVMLAAYVFFLGKISLLNMGKSIMLYFNCFEFNASFYYVMRFFGEAWYDYNPIATWGPLLTIFTAALILLIACLYLIRKSNSVFTYALFTYALYLAFAQVVHPWYIIPLIGLSLFTPWRFPIIWSFLVFFSYYAYRDPSYAEPAFILWLEYFLLWVFFVLEWQVLRVSKSSENVLL